MTTSRPAILAARLEDANDDGVFQPGEDVIVDYVLANFGGAEETLRLDIEGAPLASGAALDVRLPGRVRVAAAGPLRARLDPDVPVPSTGTLVMRLAAERRDLPLRVSYPMEFTGDIAYESLPLEGLARVRFEVVNRSRKAQEGVLVLREGLAAGGPDDRRFLGRVEPGQAVEAELTLRQVRPLDLLGGTLVVEAAVLANGELHHRRAARFPDMATRLDHPALVEYLVRLGHDPNPDPVDVDGARRLLMQRLEADWSARRAEKGNSYRDDATGSGSRTALGELVRAYERDRSVLRGSLAWNGLDDEIRALSDRLEGVHPSLRRWMRKLASRLA
jgi:hypothetical protein